MGYFLSEAPFERSASSSRRPVLSSLAAFLGAAVRPPTVLARAIVTVLSIKLLAIVAMLVFFHFSNQQLAADATAIGRLIGPVSIR